MGISDQLKKAARSGQIGVSDVKALMTEFVALGHGKALMKALAEVPDFGHAETRPLPQAASKQLAAEVAHIETLVGGDPKAEPSSIDISLNTTGHRTGPSGVHDMVIGKDGNISTFGNTSDAITNAALDSSKPPEKFNLKGELARGGVGVIHLVDDSELRRTLVMKTLIDGGSVSDYVFKKFIEEAQITAQLEHPNIVPVHEFGYFTGGEVFFTMKLVQGQTLKDILRGLRKGDAKIGLEFPRIRLLKIFEQVCMGIAFAHSRGVLHRDIKPSNIMVGDFGETLVLDWGVAKVLAAQEEENTLADEVDGESFRVTTARSESEDSTMQGLITGTPSYMAPEQAAGRNSLLDNRTDVYALGALLYEILVYYPPFRKKNHRETLRAVLREKVPHPLSRAKGRDIPAALCEICLRCLRKRPQERYPDVQGIVDDLNEYLSGVEDRDRRRRQSVEKLQEGMVHVKSYARARSEVAKMRDAVAELEWSVPSYAGTDAKRPLWAQQAQLSEAEMNEHQAFSAATRELVEAIGFDSENTEACNELARLYWQKLRQAKEANDEGLAIYYRDLVVTYDRGLFAEQLAGEARLIVRAAPGSARVLASRLVEVDHRLTPLMEEELGFTPLNNIPLDEGNWELRLQLDGYRDLVYPVRLERGQVHEFDFTLHREQTIGQHFLLIPGGSFTMGGDKTCESARHHRLVEVDDFCMARYPTTCAEYLSFLRELSARDPAEAAARAPRLPFVGISLWNRNDQGEFELPAQTENGFDWQPHWPIFGISLEDAEIYCQWYSQRTGQFVRLPTEEEWEKAARGTDGRLYPWGDHFEPIFCKMAESSPDAPFPQRVGQFPMDCSPFGVYDMAGLVSEFCGSAFSANETLGVIRGGNYQTLGGLDCRATHRRPVHRQEPSLSTGFRIVRTLSTPESGQKRRMVRPSFD